MTKNDRYILLLLGELYHKQQIRRAERLGLWSLASELILKKALFMREIHTKK